jgi:cell division protein FtsB
MGNRTSAESAVRICLRGAAGAAWIALAAYCLLSALVGPFGTAAYRRLEASGAAMRANLDSLGGANARLRVELESLRSDADRAVREARSLGYVRAGEGAIVVAGRKDQVRDYDAGTVLRFVSPASWPDSAIKEVAFGVFLAAFAAFLAPRRRSKRDQRNRRDQRASLT